MQGVVISNKIKEIANAKGLSGNDTLAVLVPKQIDSLVSLLNYCRGHFKEVASYYRDSIPNTKDSIAIVKAKSFIEKNYHNSKISLKDLTSETSSSYFSICRLFKKELNMTFTQYLALVRLNAALRLLQNLNLTIAQVSYAVGFSDAQYFDRVFKKILDCTPKEYRFSSVSKREKKREKVLSQLN